MHIHTRRSFLKQSLTGSVGLALGSMLNVPGFLRQAMADETGITWNGNKLMFIFLRGGNDGLNTLIPLGDDAYNQTTRPSLYIPGPDDALTTGGMAPANPQADRAIDLGNGFAGLHPRMHNVIPMYNAGELALIHRVGYPNQSRSHFDSQHYWETGVPGDTSLDQGIFYRTVVETGLHQSQFLPAVSLNSTMPLSIRGDVPMTNINNPERYDLLGVYAAARQKHMAHIARMHGLPSPNKQHRDLLFPTGQRFVQSIDQISSIDFADNGVDSEGTKLEGSPFLDTDLDRSHLFPINHSTDDPMFDSWSAWNFFRSLKYSAQILSNTDAVIAGTEIPSWDTHNNQGALSGQHPERLHWLSYGLHALKTYLQHPTINQWDNTVVVVMSEFGRTTIENGSFGTDHAEAGTMLVAGGAVQGGVYQCNPNDSVHPWQTGPGGSMFGVNGRYLDRAVDYRSVLGEIIRDHLGATPSQLGRIIPGYADPAERLGPGGLSIDGMPITGELGLI